MLWLYAIYMVGYLLGLLHFVAVPLFPWTMYCLVLRVDFLLCVITSDIRDLHSTALLLTEVCSHAGHCCLSHYF